MKTKKRLKSRRTVYDSRYPARQVLQIIGDTWTPIVLFCMRGRTRRFNELQRSIPDVSKKMLTQTLRKLEQRGLLNRLVHPVVPPMLITASRQPATSSPKPLHCSADGPSRTSFAQAGCWRRQLLSEKATLIKSPSSRSVYQDPPKSIPRQRSDDAALGHI